ncbi:MAG: arginine repressor [Selenomonadaceae bacterium]|nr:arginine repressor [Selenomonadaceae bacterium]
MKQRRQAKIKAIIESEIIETQDELAAALRARDFDVTQATVSRDIREMKLVKMATAEGRYRYATPESQGLNLAAHRLQGLLRDMVISLFPSENLILIKTLPGAAGVVAAAIDQAKLKDVMGTVAGHDTLLAVIKTKTAVAAVLTKLENMREMNDAEQKAE